MITLILALGLLSHTGRAEPGTESKENHLPAQLLNACPEPKKIAPYIKGCSTNYIPVDWAKSCSRALEALSQNANGQLLTTFAATAKGEKGGQTGKMINTSADLSLANLSFEQLIYAGKLFLSNQKIYQNLVAYPGGENKAKIHHYGLTKIYSSFRCVKDSVDAVEQEILATKTKINELEKGFAAASKLLKRTNERNQKLGEDLAGNPITIKILHTLASGSPTNPQATRNISSKPDARENTITGIEQAIENNREGNKILEQ